MEGTVDGEHKKNVTNVTVTMTHAFCDVMAKLKYEADWRFITTKGEAVRRRNELVEEAKLLQKEADAEADAKLEQIEADTADPIHNSASLTPDQPDVIDVWYGSPTWGSNGSFGPPGARTVV